MASHTSPIDPSADIGGQLEALTREPFKLSLQAAEVVLRLRLVPQICGLEYEDPKGCLRGWGRAELESAARGDAPLARLELAFSIAQLDAGVPKRKVVRERDERFRKLGERVPDAATRTAAEAKARQFAQKILDGDEALPSEDEAFFEALGLGKVAAGGAVVCFREQSATLTPAQAELMRKIIDEARRSKRNGHGRAVKTSRAKWDKLRAALGHLASDLIEAHGVGKQKRRATEYRLSLRVEANAVTSR